MCFLRDIYMMQMMPKSFNGLLSRKIDPTLLDYVDWQFSIDS